MIKTLLSSGLLLTLLTVPQLAQSKTVYVFDFDNTLVENREQYKGTFNPRVELYRVDGRQSLLQSPINSEKVITVSWSDFHERLKPYLAPNAEEPGMLGKRITLSDKRVIEAGHYYLRSVDSYYQFYEGEGKSNYLLETYQAAKKVRGGKDAWKGKTWPLFQYLHSSQADHLDADVLILTLRGHSPEEWNSFFKEVKRDGEIERLPDTSKIFGLTRPEMERYSLLYSHEQKHLGKAEMFKDYIKMLGRVPLIEGRDNILNPDGTKSEPYHYLVFADDNQETLKSVIEVFQEFAQGKQFRIKFGIINTGNQTEVEESGRSRFSILTSSGTFRPAKAEEVVGELATPSKLTRCALSLLQVNGGRKK